MKYFISTIIGLITGIICISLFEYLILNVFPLPANIDMQDINSIEENMDSIPLINFIMVLIGYALASFIAGFVSIKIKTHNPVLPIMIIGIVLTVFGFINFVTIPHPIWMIVIGSIIFIPMVWLGGKLGTPRISHDSIYKF